MLPSPDAAPPLLREIRGRRLFQWVFAYVAGAWILLEITDFLVGLFDLPGALVRVMLTLLTVGLVAALVVAWFHGERGRQEATRTEVALLGAIGVLGLVSVLWVGAASSWESPASAWGWRGEFRPRPLPPASLASLAPVDSTPRSMPARTRSGGAVDAAPASMPGSDPPVPSLAVLPFLNLDAVAEAATGGGGGAPPPRVRPDDTFADGVAEDILHALSRVPELRVVSRTSTAPYRGSALSLGEIGRELEVELLLEGSARRVGNQARIVVQLLDARSDVPLWSGSFDRELSDPLNVQFEVAAEVAARVAEAVAATMAAPSTEVSTVAVDPFEVPSSTVGAPQAEG